MNLNELFSGSTVQSIVKNIVDKTGLSEGQASSALQAALPMILDVVTKKIGGGEGQAGGLGNLLSGVMSNLGGSGDGKGGGIVDKITGMIDKNKDGNIMDDLSNMFGGRKK